MSNTVSGHTLLITIIGISEIIVSDGILTFEPTDSLNTYTIKVEYEGLVLYDAAPTTYATPALA
jgi:hypothetical protein